MRNIFISLLIPLLLFAQNPEDEKWYILENEVIFSPLTEPLINELRREHGVEKIENGRSVQTIVPPRSKQVYTLGWGLFNAGYAIIEDWRDAEQYYISAKAVTNSFISSLRNGKYRVRDWVYTVGDLNGLYPHFFEQHIVEGDYRKDRWTMYNPTDSTLLKMENDEVEIDTANPFVENYMSILYALRNSELVPGETLVFPTYVHGKSWDIKVIVHGTETVKVPAGEFNTIKVQPILVGDGQGFNENDEMFMWLTNDSRHIMVKGRSKARIGHINIKLSYLEVDE